MITNAAKRSDCHRAYATPIRAMWHYYSADHTLEDMATAKYWRTMMADLVPGDLVHAIDRDEEEAIFRVQHIDEELNEVGVAIERAVTYEPCTEGVYQVRHAGGRGRGSRYQIVDQDGRVVPGYGSIQGKRQADRVLQELESRIASADAA